MLAVRYVALAALVIWLAGMLPLVVGDVLRDPYVPFGCGALVLVSLIVVKFVGPPPRAFFLRAAIVAVMLTVATLAWFARVPPTIGVSVNLVLGAILLFWYAHE
jgi:hypothetical protein